jgi:hypothetical protein
MDILITLSLIFGLLSITVFGLSNIGEEPLRPPPRSTQIDCEDEDL